MKLLFCLTCGDIIAPLPKARLPRFCLCARHAIWWEDPTKGILRLFDREAVFDPQPLDWVRPGWKRKRNPHMAFVLGVHNGFLAYESNHTKESIAKILAETPTTYIFQQQNTVVIRIRPGESGDTDWSETLP